VCVWWTGTHNLQRIDWFSAWDVLHGIQSSNFCDGRSDAGDALSPVQSIVCRRSHGCGAPTDCSPSPVSRARTRCGRRQAGTGRSSGSVIFVDEAAEYWSSLDGRSQIDYSV
jgi:hypothetical protein